MSQALKEEKAHKKHLKDAKKNVFIPTDKEKAAMKFFATRKDELKEARTRKGIESIWRAADKAYQPHELGETTAKKTLVSDDSTGWRSRPIVLGREDNWQEDSVPVTPYVKIQTALGIIVDRNPSGTFTPGGSKYKKNTALMENLYKRSWEIAKSKQQLKLFVFNLAKYGFAVARTYPLKITRTVTDLVEFNPENPDETKYKEIDYTYYDDVYRESLSPWQCWIDDAAIPGNPFSVNDDMWYKDYSWDKFKEVFGRLPNFQYITPTQLSTEESASESEKNKQIKNGVRVWFYENLSRDRFYVETDEHIPLVDEPIPHEPKNKRLSLWFSHWTLRSDKDIEGIGIYEAMRGDHKLHTKIRAMTMDQLVLSIYKEFFYDGADSLQGDGIMKTRPGAGRQVVNPDKIRWNEIPGPGKDAYEGMRYQEDKMDDSTGITKGLQGDVTGKTAFEVSQAREAALKRLKTPLENITDALEAEAYITIGLIEEMYSVPQVEALADEKNLEEYKSKEIPMNLEKDKDGNFVQTEERPLTKPIR